MMRSIRVLAALLVVALGVSGAVAAQQPRDAQQPPNGAPTGSEVLGPLPFLAEASQDLPGTVCFEVEWEGSTQSGDPPGWYRVHTFDAGMAARFDVDHNTRPCTTTATAR